MKHKISIIAVAIIILFSTINRIDSYFQRILAMKNLETGEIAIFLSDIHEESTEISSEVQQQQVLNFISKLKYQGIDTHVFVEDMASLYEIKALKLIPRDADLFKKSSLLKFAVEKRIYPKIKPMVSYLEQSPLAFFKTICDYKDIKATNCECRSKFEEEGLNSPELKDIANRDEKLFERIRLNYASIDSSSTLWRPMSSIEKVACACLDANILINMRDSSAKIKIILAGAGHIGSISKILCEDGYIVTHNIFSDSPDNPIIKKLNRDILEAEFIIGQSVDESIGVEYQNKNLASKNIISSATETERILSHITGQLPPILNIEKDLLKIASRDLRRRKTLFLKSLSGSQAITPAISKILYIH